MLILRGDATNVSCTRYGRQEVWTSGLHAKYNVLKPYMQRTIVHLRSRDELDGITWNLKGVYVINSGPWTLTQHVVDRGAFCIRDSLEQGLYRLRNI